MLQSHPHPQYLSSRNQGINQYFGIACEGDGQIFVVRPVLQVVALFEGPGIRRSRLEI
jgi:hypothetical protein